jgi:hypothetical protein
MDEKPTRGPLAWDLQTRRATLAAPALQRLASPGCRATAALQQTSSRIVGCQCPYLHIHCWNKSRDQEAQQQCQGLWGSHSMTVSV